MIAASATPPLKHQRRDGYLPVYQSARLRKRFRRRLRQVDGGGRPAARAGAQEPEAGKERTPLAEMAVVCILMNHFSIYQKAENAASWNLDLSGLVPDHTTIFRAHAALDMEWLERVLTATANACMKRAWIGEASEVDTAADSTGVKTDRYEDKAKLDKKTGKKTVERVKSHLKLHVFAVLRLQIILSCAMTPSSVRDDAQQRGRHRHAAVAF